MALTHHWHDFRWQLEERNLSSDILPVRRCNTNRSIVFRLIWEEHVESESQRSTNTSDWTWSDTRLAENVASTSLIYLIGHWSVLTYSRYRQLIDYVDSVRWVTFAGTCWCSRGNRWSWGLIRSRAPWPHRWSGCSTRAWRSNSSSVHLDTPDAEESIRCSRFASLRSRPRLDECMFQSERHSRDNQWADVWRNNRRESTIPVLLASVRRSVGYFSVCPVLISLADSNRPTRRERGAEWVWNIADNRFDWRNIPPVPPCTEEKRQSDRNGIARRSVDARTRSIGVRRVDIEEDGIDKWDIPDDISRWRQRSDRNAKRRRRSVTQLIRLFTYWCLRTVTDFMLIIFTVLVLHSSVFRRRMVVHVILRSLLIAVPLLMNGIQLEQRLLAQCTGGWNRTGALQNDRFEQMIGIFGENTQILIERVLLIDRVALKALKKLPSIVDFHQQALKTMRTLE